MVYKEEVRKEIRKYETLYRTHRSSMSTIHDKLTILYMELIHAK